VSWLAFNFSRYFSYRLRLVSISCDPSFNFSIDSHTLTVIEVDGVNVQPLVVDSLEIFAGACVDYFLFLCIQLTEKQVNATPLLYVCPPFVGTFV
jgi:iron transport multicopper oxidase